MAEITFSKKKYALSDFLKFRWLLILAGLAAQIVILSMVLTNLGGPASTDITLAPVAGAPGICQVVAIRPFSDAWLPGVQPGIQIRIVGGQHSRPCSITARSLRV